MRNAGSFAARLRTLYFAVNSPPWLPPLPRSCSAPVPQVNEAFASQVVAVERELGLDRDKLNAHGGAVALGHPLGASGARILTQLAHQLARDRNGLKTALGAACIGGGQGIAVLLEQP
jgi:acetyl-CoA acetyltransferase